MSQVARTVRRVYREASAAWHVSSRVTERGSLLSRRIVRNARGRFVGTQKKRG